MTVAEILKASGMDDAAIAALDAKVLAGFNGVLTTAESERTAAAEAAKKAETERTTATAAQEAAELAQRANKEFYEQTIVPSLNGWESQEQTLKTEIANANAIAAFYKAQNEGAKAAGFVPADAPVFTPTVAPPAGRGADGKFVAGAQGGTPGSPTFTMEQVREGLGNTLGTVTDIQWKYQRLYGTPMPVAPTELVRQAEAQKMNPADYAAKTFNFAAKEQEMVARQQAEERAKIAAEAVAPYEQKIKDNDAEWQKKLDDKAKEISERGGNNPDVRRAAISNFPEVKKAVEAGTRPDPLSFKNQAERRAATRQQIITDVNANEEAKVGAAA